MPCWYWVADFKVNCGAREDTLEYCENLGIDFILGHTLYMKAIHGGKAKNDRVD